MPAPAGGMPNHGKHTEKLSNKQSGESTMKFKLTSLIAIIALSLGALTAHADPRITEVMNDSTATNGCTVNSVYGYGGYNFNVIIYGVDCPSEPVVVYTEKKTTWYSWGGLSCEMSTNTTGYFTAGVCGDYSVYKYD